MPIKPVSVVGAGDSFLGAMIWSLASGHALATAFRYEMAAGSAALLEPGTELCRRENVEHLLASVEYTQSEIEALVRAGSNRLNCNPVPKFPPKAAG